MAVKTLTDIVESTSVYDIRNVSYMAETDGIVYVDTHLFDKYRDVVDEVVQEYTVSPSDMDTFKFKPDLLSMKVYGTTDLAWLILYLNNIESASRFKLPRKLKLIPKDSINTIFDILITKNADKIKQNKIDLGIT